MSEFDNLPTEAINPATQDLSRLPTLEALALINDEDQKVALAVRKYLPQIARAVDEISARMKDGGRLFYVGAGTSGRLGVLDASECPPTFGTPREWVQGIIAGGDEAVFRSIEGAEDDAEAGAHALREKNLTAADCVVGLAASGRTPYAIGALKYARQIGAWTGGVSVNPQAAMEEFCDVFVSPEVGPEALAGSSRMKAGTAQKMVLNMISTGVMLRLGRVEGNVMSNVQAWCEKLVDRAARNVSHIAGVDSSRAQQALAANGNDVARAVAWLRGEGTPST
jgi:N-acetylmuramic acid 6-phosphate etherase